MAMAREASTRWGGAVEEVEVEVEEEEEEEEEVEEGAEDEVAVVAEETRL